MARNKLKRSWTFVGGVLITYVGYKWIYSLPTSSSTGFPFVSLLGILVTVFGLLILGKSFFNE